MSIQELVQQGKKITERSDFERMKAEFLKWSEAVRRGAIDWRLPEKTRQILNVKLHYIENEYSPADSMTALKRAVEDTTYMLETLGTTCTDDFSEDTKQLIVEKILTNFHLHIKAMYQMKTHGKGTIQQADLNRIKIGNEYDVQRILYSLLVPIFPEIRTEVDGDNGYSGTRTDIYLNQNKIAIEIKCTRKSMTEKDLVEQLGADGFHYQVNTLFLFVYDKEGIIRNVAAFEAAFRRTPQNGGKTIRAIVIQPVNL